MLLLPFVLVAFAAGFSQSLRPGARPLDHARSPSPAPVVQPTKPAIPPSVAIAPSAVPPASLPRVTELAPVVQRVVDQPDTASRPDPPALLKSEPLASAVLAPVDSGIAVAAATPPHVDVPATAPDGTFVGPQPPAVEIAAVLVPDPASVAPGGTLAPDPAPAIAANVCVAPPRDLAKSIAPPAIAPPRDPAEFGVALAAAALSQTREFVVYNDKYRRIAYPMGDVPSFYGVCTDVLIRAFRALSIDLQALVQQTRSGSGDPNIDHRRVDTLRRFFAAHGQSIPISEHAEDYRPGDIVSYWRPQNRHSRTHIAIVANEIGPSGRPMIIHNRGWGPQLEDGLFVDQLTGHYRFTGLRSAPVATPPRSPAKPTAAQNGAQNGARRAGLGNTAAIRANAATP